MLKSQTFNSSSPLARMSDQNWNIAKTKSTETNHVDIFEYVMEDCKITASLYK